MSLIRQSANRCNFNPFFCHLFNIHTPINMENFFHFFLIPGSCPDFGTNAITLSFDWLSIDFTAHFLFLPPLLSHFVSPNPDRWCWHIINWTLMFCPGGEQITQRISQPVYLCLSPFNCSLYLPFHYYYNRMVIPWRFFFSLHCTGGIAPTTTTY